MSAKKGIEMKTSKLICLIFHNEGTIESNKITSYIGRLVELGYLQTIGTKITLTNKGAKYITRGL